MSEKAKLVGVRYVERRDLGRMLAVEAKAHLFPDPDDQAVAVRDQRQMREREMVGFVERADTRVSVLEADGLVVGYLMLDCSDEGRNKAVITRLSVEPRRRGYGTALLAEAERRARLAEAKSLVAYVYEEDLAAQEFFKAKGWKSRVARRHYGERPAWEFSRSLTERD
jgi:ribosomal protein S18 acetylase RimI-like enzyme